MADTAFDATYLEELARHRRSREQKLRAPDGWLSLVGRWVLTEGETPIDDAVASLDAAGRVSLRFLAGVDARDSAGRPVREHAWQAHEGGPGPFVFVGTRRYELLRQRARIAVRARDAHSASLTAFTGIPCYAPDPRFLVRARLEPADPPRTITLPTGLGGEVTYRCPGTLVFSIDGRALTLDPTIEDDAPTRLFILFKDLTNLDETYGAGRFLYAPLPDDKGELVLDFNKAFNPPCALTEFASCPVTPAQNRLPIRVVAGEQRVPSAHG